MDVFTPERSFKMVSAVDKVYGFDAVVIEQVVYNVAGDQVEGYEGGVWHFHTDGEIGFWVPNTDTVAVNCPNNYYSNPDMDAVTFGAGATLIALNQLVWHFHHQGRDDVARRLQSYYDKLYNWAYSDHSPLDIDALFGYLD